MPALRLYGLQGCPHCEQALQFLTARKLPFDVVVANGDPVISEGIKALLSQKAGHPILLDEYPLLVSQTTNEVIVGWKPEEYERIGKIFDVLFRTGTLDLSAGGQRAGEEVQATAPAVAPRAPELPAL